MNLPVPPVDPDERIDAYTYELPPELIAREPAPRRDEARLLVVERETGRLTDSRVSELPDWLRPHDRLIMNNSRVVPARLVGQRTRTGAKWEGLFLREASPGRWELLGKTRGKLEAGETIRIPAEDESRPSLELNMIEKRDDGSWLATPTMAGMSSESSAFEWLAVYGRIPLPPYMEREPVTADRDRYQTTYASVDGSVAAPTAGLHFTPELFSRCVAHGIERDEVTLHVGIGTFRPVSAERLADHTMHYEWCELSAAVVERLHSTRAAGGRIVAVGTTSVRTLETASSAAKATGAMSPGRFTSAYCGETNLFIRPPYLFQSVDALLTNFHLPQSTLLVLVSCFAGRELIRDAYAYAVRERYRFFSYGDAMLIV